MGRESRVACMPTSPSLGESAAPMENSPPGIQTILDGVALGAGVVLGTVGPNVAGLEVFVDDGASVALAGSTAWRERYINATMPARASAAITARTSHFFGCDGGAGSTAVACDLPCSLGLVAMAGALGMILTLAPSRCHW